MDIIAGFLVVKPKLHEFPRLKLVVSLGAAYPNTQMSQQYRLRYEFLLEGSRDRLCAWSRLSPNSIGGSERSRCLVLRFVPTAIALAMR